MAVLCKHGVPGGPVLLPASARTYAQARPLIHLLSDGMPSPEPKGKELIPTAAQALSLGAFAADFPRAELTLEQAQRYLHRESLVLPAGVPRGFVVVTYQGCPLGFVKNLGERANNLYPKNWAVRKL